MSQNSYLDQILLEDITRYCPTQFLALHQCMAKQDPKGNNCSEEQFNLSNCIKKDVPSFQKIQGICAGKLQAYEACLRLSGSDTKKCVEELQSLRECAFETLDK